LWRTQFGSFPVGSFVPEFRVGNAIHCPALELLDLSGPSVLLAIVLRFSHPNITSSTSWIVAKKKKIPCFSGLKNAAYCRFSKPACSTVLCRIFGFFPNNNYFRFVFFQA